MGKGGRSPQLYPCYHLAQRSGPVHGGREYVTTFLPLSPFSTEGWASLWGKGVGHHIFSLVAVQHRRLGQFMGEGSRSPHFQPCNRLAQKAGQVHGGGGVGHHNCTLVTIQQRGLGQFMGQGSRSPKFYPCHHLAQKAGQVHGGKEQVTTIVPLSPFSTEVCASSWRKGVGHHIFTLVTIYHRGLGQFMGGGIRSPHFLPGNHLAQRAGPVHGGREQVTKILPLSPISTEDWASSWGREVGHHIFTLFTIQHTGLGQFMGKRSRSPKFYPCHQLAQRAVQVLGEGKQVTTFLPLSPFSTEGWASLWGREVGNHMFYLVTIKHTGPGQFMGEGSRSPQLYPYHHLAQRSGSVHG